MSAAEPLRPPPNRVIRRVRHEDDLEEPIRAELFSVERLEDHARSLAAVQKITTDPSHGRAVASRLAENGRVLAESYRALARAIEDERAITPAAEWLVDNFPVVDEQLREIRDDLPANYYEELPKLAEGHLAGYPRVIGVAWAYIAHTDSLFEPDSLRRMIRAYQEVESLTLGELWAVAISLRFLLVDNLRRIAVRIVRSRADRQRADEIADSLLGLGRDTPDEAAAGLRRLSPASFSEAARVQLFQRLRDQDPDVTPGLRWLDRLVRADNTTPEEIVRLEHQRQATMNVTVRNVITSMRLISWFDWAQFVESVSVVEDVLRETGSFAAMDFATRDRYRHAIETLAKRSGLEEVEVAQRAVALADDANVSPVPAPGSGSADGPAPGARAGGEAAAGSRADRPPPPADVGWWLIEDGRPAFERSLGIHPPLAVRLRRAYAHQATGAYLGSIALVTALILGIPLFVCSLIGAPTAATVALALLATVPASDLAIALVNRAVTDLLGPVTPPRLDLDDGVPTSLRTLVVVPTLLASEADAEAQVGQLEVHYLANRDGDIRFSLLSDWLDAPDEHMPGDEAILASAVAAIDRLNERHGEAPGGGARFLLFHRRRRWNAAEGRWMGWERKRGKLDQLNDLLRGSIGPDFVPGDRPSSAPPPDVRYVVTLDADTRMPRGAVGRLVGTLAHPLNRPVVDPLTRRVVRGYGILQPRITPTLPTEHEASIYQRVFSGSAGIDPYASAVSDVYQDLFGEGSFTGKGIYDVDAFREALAGRVPENALLSHDLFEGVFARAGLVTDIELFDEFPSNYLVEASRQHRWARGDWQLLPWILGRSRDATGRRARNAMPGIARWKMVDNLRRTLSAPFTVATLVAAWLAGGVPLAATWTGFILATAVIPAALPVVAGLRPRRPGISKRSHLRAVGADLAIGASQVGVGVVLLAHQAWLMADAIGRTLTRLLVTRRSLLEWTTAAQAKATHRLEAPAFYGQMRGAVAIAVAAAAGVVLVNPAAAPIAAPFVAGWLLSPAIARWLSLPRVEPGLEPLTEDDATDLRLTGRRTWRFFEAFVGPDTNALPPDNFQDDPAPLVARRTSPTNIGMYLLSAVTARDFGWIGTLEMVERIEATLATVDRLERYRGHLFNWYATDDLRRLDPMYVSTVDSGNLAGHLLTLANACRQMVDQPLPTAAALQGIGDAIALTRRASRHLRADRRGQTLTRGHLDAALASLIAADDRPVSTADWAGRLGELSTAVQTLGDVVATLAEEHGDGLHGELVSWSDAARSCVASHVRDLAVLGGVAPGTAPATAGTDGGPRLAELADADRAAGRSADGTGRPADPIPAADLVERLERIASHARRLFDEMDFGFLFDPTRKLFSIGFRALDGSLDPSYYDLLASEARLTSFLAIAKGDVPAEHWFRLGRAMTPVGRDSALISWSGSMFEYLMPALVMREPVNSLLGQTARLVVARQMSYAADRGVPWGISESAFNARDLQQAYQYSSFGVPGLGLKRGLSEDLVVAPYATALGAMIRPHSAVRNIGRLVEAGAGGAYGLREALDYTPRRLPEGAEVAVVKSYMAHHQGMALVAIGNVLNGAMMVDRFHADPIVEATELLLQERMPRDVLVARPRAEEAKSAADVRDLVPPAVRRFTSPHDAIPRTHLLSNSRYAVMMTAAGSGYSRWGDIAVTRWREDATRDSWGSYLFVRDAESGAVWSAGHQPSGAEADRYEVIYSEDHVELTRRDGSLVTGLSVVVSAEHDAEIRRVTVSNLGSRPRVVELTSYAEIALAPQAADVAHPAFQNLFVETEYVADAGALLATRRQRSPSDPSLWAGHVLALEDGATGAIEFETDRARFVGRGRSVRTAVAVHDGRPLTKTVGPVLDPIFSLRTRLRLAPGSTVHATFSTVVAGSRTDALDVIDKLREPGTFQRAATLAWTQAQVQLHHLGIESDEAHLFQRIANRIIYSDPSLRPSSERLARNRRGAAGLWAHGISGDLPIVVARVSEVEDLDIVRQLVRAHEYWRLKLLPVDLVILNEHGATYAQDFAGSLEAIVRSSQARIGQDGQGNPGGVHLLPAERLSVEDRTLIEAIARVVVVGRRGTLADQVIRVDRAAPREPSAAAVRQLRSPAVVPVATAAPADLEFFNGLGGFADDGREYVTVLGPGQATPAPWSNVVANAEFGFLVTESGGGYTWAGNSRENQLTPWSNDPVSDPVGEAIYVRDDETGEIWTPGPEPIRVDGSTYVVHHGRGYSRFEHEHDGIVLDLVQFVPLAERLKVSVLGIENRSDRPRRLSVTAYVEWVLGVSRAAGAHRIVTSVEPATGALLARDPWNTEFAGHVGVLDLRGRQTAWTADRTEFLGRNGGPERPAGLEPGHRLAGRVGAGLDPCGVLGTTVELAAGSRTEIVVLLGEADDETAAAELVRRGRAVDLAAERREIERHWESVTGAIQIRTPERAMDVLVNRWLLYQTLACRIWGRTAFYQAGGAFGFRDQLQDVLALLPTDPAVARGQILAAAARQFTEGDVQHWWHPPSGAGVRTRISDDRLWLPYVVRRYTDATGDAAILDESAPWLEGPALPAEQDDSYFRPDVAGGAGSVYDHCAAAIDVSLTAGAHSLPLMGSGDWNDGMNRVGRNGGESVWLGWFLATVLTMFLPVAEARGDRRRAKRWRAFAATLRAALEREAWDGSWYRRAYFGDGTPLGSAHNDECRIDAIAQSWSVLAGGDPVRAAQAMAAVDAALVRRDEGLALLFTPPFAGGALDPGYIKGYVPGIRENGGQYTHAAIWSILAYAHLGDGDRAGELFGLLNPINHGRSRAGILRYKVEPYVMAADVYSEPPHVGRGGWTWYTGSASWMYQAAVEWILGVRRHGTALSVDPCIPAAWPGFEVELRHGAARYIVVVDNPAGVCRGIVRAEIDGGPVPDPTAPIELVDDGAAHRIRLTMGRAPEPATTAAAASAGTGATRTRQPAARPPGGPAR